MLYSGMFFEFSSSSLDTILGYARGLVSDISPILLLIIGVAIAMLVIVGLVSVIKR